MNRFALTAVFALGLTLAACNNEPEESEASSEDSLAPTAPETINGDEVVSEGPTDDATPYSGGTDGTNAGSNAESTTGGSGVSSSGGAAGQRAAGSSGGQARGSGAESSGSGSMIRGGSNTAGARPPKGSKLQKADPR